MNSQTEKRNHNPLNVLVLPRSTAPGEDNPTGCGGAGPVLCCHVFQAIQLEELMDQDLFAEREVEVYGGSIEEALALLDEPNAEEGAGCSALICTASDLERLGMAHRIRGIFMAEDMIPVVPEIGRNAVEARGEAAFRAAMKAMESPEEEGMSAVYAEGDEEELELWSLYCDSRTGCWWTDWIMGSGADAEALGKELAMSTKKGGPWAEEDRKEDTQYEDV